MNVAFIPVRGGSKSIPLKNIKPICGKPLVYWTMKSACESSHIDKVYICTDSNVIRKTVTCLQEEMGQKLFSKVEVIGRSAQSASDTASTESVMLEFAEKYEFDNVILIQATSPLLEAKDIDHGFEAYEEQEVDSVLSVVKQKRFIWEENGDGYVMPSNYDVFRRPRRQEFEGYYVENGAFYICSREGLLKYRNRVYGRIKAVEMCEESFFEIDEPSDWIVIEEFMRRRRCAQKEHIPEIKLFLTDCDGCLTDGGMYYSEKGDELKKFQTKDGMGFALLRDAGIMTGIITGENVDINRRRAKKLRLDILEMGCQDKLGKIRELCEKHQISMGNVCYIGDDVNDLEAVSAVGYGCCPADAIEKVKAVADYVTKATGGNGVIREVIEQILQARG